MEDTFELIEPKAYYRIATDLVIVIITVGSNYVEWAYQQTWDPKRMIWEGMPIYTANVLFEVIGNRHRQYFMTGKPGYNHKMVYVDNFIEYAPSAI